MDDALADEVLSDLVVKWTEGERYDSTGQSRRASRLSGAAVVPNPPENSAQEGGAGRFPYNQKLLSDRRLYAAKHPKYKAGKSFPASWVKPIESPDRSKSQRRGSFFWTYSQDAPG